MAVTSNGLSFHPLYWIHHDCWKWFIPGNPPSIHYHWGHVHFFMMGFPWASVNGDAFFGQMSFKFELKDIWGPRSGDPNQALNYRVIGTPKWYFHIQEVWRRVYIQPWEHPDNPQTNDFTRKRGIKYDASQPQQTFGPFREGRQYTPLFLHSPRTLPIEYFQTSDKLRDRRDNYIKNKFAGLPAGTARFPYTEEFYVPPVDGAMPIKDSPGGYDTFADGLYIYPTLEYQKVVQLEWERLPGYALKNDKSPTEFGDGWSLEVNIPFRDPTTTKYRSPFAAQPGQVDPPGVYHNNLVALDKQLKFRTRDYTLPDGGHPDGGYDYKHRPFGMSETNSNQPLTFQNPYNSADGRWVQQCVGGIVQAKAEVTIESKLNDAGPDGYKKVWVHATQYIPEDRFAGVDQKLGSAT